MNKKVRILLYLMSITVTALVLTLMVFHQRLLKPVGTQADSGQKEEQNIAAEETELSNTENMEMETEAETETETEAEEPQEETTLIFAGDVLLSNAVANVYDSKGVTQIVSKELLAEMQNADILMVNNEFQFSNRGTPMEDKQYTFQTEPKNVQILLDMGVDIVSLANNHTIDFGTEALEDTFETLEKAGILYAGAGDTKEQAEALQIIEVNGKKFGFLAATRVIPVVEWNIENRQPGLFAAYDDTRLVERIKESKEVCDYLTVYLHWGVEREEYPQEYQTTIAAHCFEAGADLVIGAHPHILQGIEFMDGKPVFYSLGNYIFNQSIPKTALIKVVVKADGTAKYSMIPAFASGGKTQMFEDEEAGALFTYMNEISKKDYVNSDGSIIDK